MPIVVRSLDTQERVRSLTPAESVGAVRNGTALAPTSCCGGAAATGADACCALDAEAKAGGGSGCGCVTPAPGSKAPGCC